MQEELGAETKIFQLGGGIVRYLEEYGAEGYFRGKHYVFDHRRVEDPRYSQKLKNSTTAPEEVLSQCFVCASPWDDTQGQRRCSVVTCRMPVLVCRLCQSRGDDAEATLLCELCASGASAPSPAKRPCVEAP